MNNENLKTSIQDVIKANGNQEITGDLLQQSLIAIINQFGSGSVFGGFAVPSTMPTNTDVNMFYMAKVPGTYTNFGGYVLESGKITIFDNKTGVWLAEDFIEVKSLRENDPIVKTSTVGLIDTYTIYYNDGDTTTYEIKNGSDSAVLPFVGSVFPLVAPTPPAPPIQRTYQGSIWELKEGKTASDTDFPTYDPSSKWNSLSLSINSVFNEYINPTLQVGALVTSTGAPIDSTTRGRTSDFTDISYAGNLELLGDMVFQNIFYYNSTGGFISFQAINGKTFIPTKPINAAKFKVSFNHVVNTQLVTQTELNALKVYFYSSDSISFDDIIENTKKSEKVVADYDDFIVNLGQDVYKELGGISTSDGSDSPNNIRIRTARIKLTDGDYRITQDAGYLISRVVFYKDGAFKSFNVFPDFSIDISIANEVRLVWSKTNASTVITQAEVDAFNFNLEKLNVNKFEQLEQLIDNSQSNSTSWFSNKKISSIGDSITYGFIPRNYPGYPGQLDSFAKQSADLLGMVWNNQGISGSTLGQISSSDTTTRSPMCNRFSAMPSDAKVITFMGGTNDLRNISNLGTMADRIPETYYGALHILIKGLLNKYIYSQNLILAKDIIIVGITPIKIYPDSTHNSLKMIDYVNAMKEVCAYYSIPCFDAYNLSGMTPGEFRTLQGTEVGYTDIYNPLITDGVHPTTEGHAIFAERFAGFLKTLVY